MCVVVIRPGAPGPPPVDVEGTVESTAGAESVTDRRIAMARAAESAARAESEVDLDWVRSRARLSAPPAASRTDRANAMPLRTSPSLAGALSEQLRARSTPRATASVAGALSL
jgi:hypothetical protein